MESSNMIVWMIAACAAFVVLIMASKPVKAVVKVCVQAILGSVLMYAANFFLAPFSLFVGVNVLTAFIVGVLGLPGLFTLYILQAFL